MRKSRKGDWVVCGGKNGEVGHCTRCGRGLVLTMPMELYLVTACMKAFTEQHLGCKEGAWKEPQATSPQEWLSGRDTGTSSRTIYSVMQHTAMERYDIPHDPADFGRCYRLLALFPEWGERLADVARVHAAWRPFVENWAELTALYEKGTAPKLYARMQKLKKAA
jgi:hypothetical protein